MGPKSKVTPKTLGLTNQGMAPAKSPDTSEKPPGNVSRPSNTVCTKLSPIKINMKESTRKGETEPNKDQETQVFKSSQCPSQEKTGTDKSGTDKSGTDKSGTDKSGTGKSGTDKSSTDKSGTDKSGTKKSSDLAKTGTVLSGKGTSGTGTCGKVASGTEGKRKGSNPEKASLKVKGDASTKTDTNDTLKPQEKLENNKLPETQLGSSMDQLTPTKKAPHTKSSDPNTSDALKDDPSPNANSTPLALEKKDDEKQLPTDVIEIDSGNEDESTEASPPKKIKKEPLDFDTLQNMVRDNSLAKIAEAEAQLKLAQARVELTSENLQDNFP